MPRYYVFANTDGIDVSGESRVYNLHVRPGTNITTTDELFGCATYEAFSLNWTYSATQVFEVIAFPNDAEFLEDGNIRYINKLILGPSYPLFNRQTYEHFNVPYKEECIVERICIVPTTTPEMMNTFENMSNEAVDNMSVQACQSLVINNNVSLVRHICGRGNELHDTIYEILMFACSYGNVTLAGMTFHTGVPVGTTECVPVGTTECVPVGATECAPVGGAIMSWDQNTCHDMVYALCEHVGVINENAMMEYDDPVDESDESDDQHLSGFVRDEHDELNRLTIITHMCQSFRSNSMCELMNIVLQYACEMNYLQLAQYAIEHQANKIDKTHGFTKEVLELLIRNDIFDQFLANSVDFAIRRLMCIGCVSEIATLVYNNYHASEMQS